MESLANGIMGQVFCSSTELSDETLFDSNTIIDLSRVGSSETKSLLMGVVVMKLNEHRMATATGENVPLKHITILEEAHNLLRNSHGMSSGGEGGNAMGKSVEMISNSIAEMRTYGEGFIIVDQSPTAVDISAIKNTNTKIVMRLPEKNDQETVGNAFSLTPEQIREISRLDVGMAVIGQNGWLQPVLTKSIAGMSSTSKPIPNLSEIKPGWTTHKRTGQSSRTSTSPSLIVKCGREFRR